MNYLIGEKVLQDEYECCRCGKLIHNTKLKGIDLQGIHMGEIDSLDEDSLYCAELSKCDSEHAREMLKKGRALLDATLPVKDADCYLLTINGDGRSYIVDVAQFSASEEQLNEWAGSIVDREESNAEIVQGFLNIFD